MALTIRQNVPFTAAGIVLRGLGVSEAARPTSSVPAEKYVSALIFNTSNATYQKRRQQ